MKKQIQILYIHGGMTFKSKKDYINYLKTKTISLDGFESWSGTYLSKKLGSGFQVIRPQMPLKENAKYEEWKIHFEKYLPLLKNNLILIGYSLGGIFLAKYLSENKFPKKILSTYLIASPYDNSLSGEDLVGGFKLKPNLSLIEQNTKNLYLLFSKDDPVIPLEHAEKYAKKLPHAKIGILHGKNGHFRISEFPEIIKMIKRDVKNK